MEWSAKVESAPCMREWRLPVILRARMLNVSPAYAGWRDRHRLRPRRQVVSPAHVGVEAVIRTTRPDQTSQPCARGGRGSASEAMRWTMRSAPRMRGFTRICG